MSESRSDFFEDVRLFCWSSFQILVQRVSSTCSVREGICVDPPLCRGTSQGKYGSCTKGLVCVGENVGKIGAVDEMGER